jgi:hypothetical protein
MNNESMTIRQIEILSQAVSIPALNPTVQPLYISGTSRQTYLMQVIQIIGLETSPFPFRCGSSGHRQAWLPSVVSSNSLDNVSTGGGDLLGE